MRRSTRILVVATVLSLPAALTVACGGTSPECQAVGAAFDAAAEAGGTGEAAWRRYGQTLREEATEIPDDELQEAVDTVGDLFVSLADWEFDGPFPGPSSDEVDEATETIRQRCGRSTDLPTDRIGQAGASVAAPNDTENRSHQIETLL